MSDNPATATPPEPSREPPTAVTRIPRAARARLLLHRPEADPAFMDMLCEALPDEAARLAYLNHLAWEART